MDKIQRYLAENPEWAGVLIAAFGIFLVLASAFDWNSIFGDINAANYSTRKIDGLVNLFGRKTARVICGCIGCIVFGAGVVWVCIYLKR